MGTSKAKTRFALSIAVLAVVVALWMLGVLQEAPPLISE